jgi:putative nucleotidyltransferase with HDIG domain
MSDWVVREGRPLIFNPDTGESGKRVDAVTGARAALCVPLLASDGTIGTVAIGSSDQHHRFTSDDVRLLSTIANHVTIAIGNIELFTSLQEAYLATVRSLAAAVDAKDTYTRGHSDRVATYSTAIAEGMGLSHEQRIALEMAAYLHDIGKIGVAEDILLKPGKLDDAEMAQMRHHPLIGANILKPVTFPWAITPVVRHHHEHFDGSGYPAGLRGEEIPLLARILTVADSYEAMTADRPYRQGRNTAAAIEELERCAGTQFDPRVVAAFTEVLSELEHEGVDLVGHEPDDHIPTEEARAIFAAIVDGVFSSFRRLGGPKLAANVEAELDSHFESAAFPFRLTRGRIVFTEEPEVDVEGEVSAMRESLRRMDAIMGRVSGAGLVDHFYTEAFEKMSSRMRAVAAELDFFLG